ncbi:WD repeat-containing protein 70 [Desmophyllum pertusum]|uniref:WD repeat-containing protein 70 n=1 Tax=Desmophyllum pertusum TaxID=174260 RepID=A0A9W9ZBJ8_9CNID|nr:WD repeat-containing protein 70 [Desmophyllum pertusum]
MFEKAKRTASKCQVAKERIFQGLYDGDDEPAPFVIMNTIFKTLRYLPLALDPSGSTAGEQECMIIEAKLWDFKNGNGCFSSVPSELYSRLIVIRIKSVQYSITGDVILIAAGKCTQVIDRDGIDVLECVKGDCIYLSDMANTTDGSIIQAWRHQKAIYSHQLILQRILLTHLLVIGDTILSSLFT